MLPERRTPGRTGNRCRAAWAGAPGDQPADRPVAARPSDLRALARNTIATDCDVLQADGAHTAAITGAYGSLRRRHLSGRSGQTLRPRRCRVRSRRSVAWSTAASASTCPYEEDSRAEVDMNVVATDTGTLVQGCGRGATFPRSTLDKLLDAALGACDTLFAPRREH